MKRRDELQEKVVKKGVKHLKREVMEGLHLGDHLMGAWSLEEVTCNQIGVCGGHQKKDRIRLGKKKG